MFYQGNTFYLFIFYCFLIFTYLIRLMDTKLSYKVDCKRHSNMFLSSLLSQLVLNKTNLLRSNSTNYHNSSNLLIAAITTSLFPFYSILTWILVDFKVCLYLQITTFFCCHTLVFSTDTLMCLLPFVTIFYFYFHFFHPSTYSHQQPDDWR